MILDPTLPVRVSFQPVIRERVVLGHNPIIVDGAAKAIRFEQSLKTGNALSVPSSADDTGLGDGGSVRQDFGSVR